jgi:phospholipase C
MDEALQRLLSVRHVVVVMMENRSFDQMLGYLMRDGLPEVRGLRGDECNPDPDGRPVTVFEWRDDQTAFHPPQDHTGKILDPCHGKGCVTAQLRDGNRGFVTNFLATRRDRHGNAVTIPEELRRLPMGHYGRRHLPTYDFLARTFCVCDAWHSSVPGDTWPNRLFAAAAREGPHAVPGLIERIGHLLGEAGARLESAPIYDVRAFTEELGDEQWRWYAHDPATLRAIDGRYRDFGHADRDNFAYFDRQAVSVVTRALEEGIVSPDSFLDDCARGRLRDVSWIDPNFIDLSVLDPASNDDHPPADIRAGQQFVLEIFQALRSSPEWDDTILVVVYDEHGGFYDHVVPPRTPAGDESGYATYGVRVPALIAGPRVANAVCHQLFDHTSLVATILRRFAPDPGPALARMGKRAAIAAHLGSVLLDRPRRDLPEPTDARAAIDDWHQAARAARRPAPDGGPSSAPDGAGHRFELDEFQEGFASFALTMRHAGLPAGHP